MHTSVKVGPLEFQGWAANGFLISPNGITGWDNAPSSRRTDAVRVGGHGSFGTSSLLNGRLVTIAGNVLAESEPELLHFLDLLAAMPVRKHRMTVQDVRGSRWCDVVVEGEPQVSRTGGDREAEYQVSFFASNPRKFGEQRVFTSTGSSVPAFHYGNFDADPVFEVSGFVNGYRITGPGGDFTVSGPRPSGAVDVVDFSTGLLTRDGVPLTRAVTSAKLWTVGPGERVSWRVQPVRSGSGSARLLLTDTFI